MGQPVTITVKHAPLTITANDKHATAGDPLPAFDATTTGLVAGDSRASALTKQPTCTTTATATPAPGSYPISCTGAQAPNYMITYRPGTLVVAARPPQAARPLQAARTLTLDTRRIFAIKRSTRRLRISCRLDQPRLDACALTLKAGRRTLATGQAQAAPGQSAATVTLRLTKRTRKLARRPGGLNATLRATATQVNGPALTAKIRLLLAPSAVISAPTDGLFQTGRAKLPPDGTRYLRRLRALVTGAQQITCTGHTDTRGSTESNRRLGLARAKAVCQFLTAGTDIRTRARSQGETNPRAPNTTAKGRASNRHVSIQVGY